VNNGQPFAAVPDECVLPNLFLGSL
jgi:hypothetical protein